MENRRARGRDGSVRLFHESEEKTDEQKDNVSGDNEQNNGVSMVKDETLAKGPDAPLGAVSHGHVMQTWKGQEGNAPEHKDNEQLMLGIGAANSTQINSFL